MARVVISALVTNCSARKSAGSAPGLTASDFVSSPQSAIAERWLAAISHAPAATNAGDLYIGRGVKRIKCLAELVGAKFYIASGGLGFLKATDMVPSYDLSVSAGTPSAVQCLVSGKFSAKDWWSSLQRSRYARPIRQVCEGDGYGLILVAASNSYVSLFADELGALEKASRNRLRLFGAVDSKYPPHLRSMLMPYDSRLDLLIRGSKVDFAQRAAEHFLNGITADDDFPAAIDDQRTWVKDMLGRVITEPAEKRQAADDARIRALAEKMATQGLSHTKALSKLRQQYGIACEQSRFRRLFLEATA